MIVVRPATLADLPGILALEVERYAEIDPSAAADEAVMAHRITLLNDYPGSPGWFYVAIDSETGELMGDIILMPTSLAPEETTTWEAATDNGQLTGTFDAQGKNVYGISFAVKKNAPDMIAVWLVFHGLHLVAKATGTLFLCARMPGFRQANETTGIAAEDYWCARKVNGLPQDWELEIFEDLIGAKPVRFLPGGYTLDLDSGGHGVLCVSENPYPQMAGLRIYLETEFKQDTSTYPKTSQEKAAILIGGRADIFDVAEQGLVDTLTLYLPYGCPDWGTRGVLGERLPDRCRFCALPSGPDLFAKLYQAGKPTSTQGHIALLEEAWRQAVSTEGIPHTLRLFNGGSALAMHRDILARLSALCVENGVQRLVIEARAKLVTENRLAPMMKTLDAAGIKLTVRIGIETQDDEFRQNVLGKGQSREEIARAVSVASDLKIDLGSYVLLKPAPGITDSWAREEATKTINWILDELGFHEVYLSATCISPSSPIFMDWKEKRFSPPSPWDVLWVLRAIDKDRARNVHLLPMKDFPPFVAVPSVSKPHGISQYLTGASPADLAFHALFNDYRETMDSGLLQPPPGVQVPSWFSKSK